MNSRTGFVFASGFSAAAVQIVFIREYLTVFSGNELVIGIIFALWLLMAALGSFTGARLNWWNGNFFCALYVISVLLGFTLIRASRLLFDPGEIIPPLWIPVITLITQSDAAFFGGLVFGRVSKIEAGKRVYLIENVGALFGLLMVCSGILLFWSNSALIAAILALFFNYIFISNDRKSGSSQKFLAVSALTIAAFLILEPISLQWKYHSRVQEVKNGYQGEIAKSRGEETTLTFLNNSLYNSEMSLPAIEQSVHIPAAMCGENLRTVLVIGNTGQVKEIGKYPGIEITCRESEPLLSDSCCAYGDVLKIPAGKSFDLVLLSAGIPSTVQSSRYYTREFYRKIHKMTAESGIFSFSLPLGENFLSPDEKKLKDLIQTTLFDVFKQVFIIPGSGSYTFIASDYKIPWPIALKVKTDYLERYTIASLTDQRISIANSRLDSTTLNTLQKPVALYFAQKQWLGIFGIPFLTCLAGLGLIIIIIILLSPRTGPAVSIGTTGFVTGLYSISLMLLYQFIHGSLYAAISILMVGLIVGFVCGSLVKKFPFSDAAIGVYSLFSLITLVTLTDPPIILFLFFHAGIGFLSAAQFVSRKGTAWDGLYTADLLGGVIGMALGSTILIPYIGVPAIAFIIMVLKVISGMISKNT